MDIAELLEQARQQPEVSHLEGAQAEGAEAYLHAIEVMGKGDDALEPDDEELCGLAAEYLDLSVPPCSQTHLQREGARIARETIERLQ
jgi:hypothetical protein